MFKNLSLGAIGIRGFSLPQAIDLAKRTGFAGIDFDIKEAAALADERGLDAVRTLFAQAGVRPGAWGLPVAWNRVEAEWRQGLEALPRLAALGRDIGCVRTATWVPPNSTERAFAENFEWHVARFQPIAEILKAYNCRLGLEFIGPQTLRPPDKHAFIYSLEGMLELIEAIGTGNVGLLLDAWHLFTSGGQLDDLDKLKAEDIVTVHVNDAPAGLTLETYLDNDRRLPMETGVMDLPGFMQKLVKLGYDGPVTPEPFSQRVNAIAATSPLDAAQLTADYMDQLWQVSGLS
jgi:sugar phosphate isomerase/epimerase